MPPKHTLLAFSLTHSGRGGVPVGKRVRARRNRARRHAGTRPRNSRGLTSQQSACPASRPGLELADGEAEGKTRRDSSLKGKAGSQLRARSVGAFGSESEPLASLFLSLSRSRSRSCTLFRLSTFKASARQSQRGSDPPASEPATCQPLFRLRRPTKASYQWCMIAE